LVKHSRHFYNHLSDSRTPGNINFPTNGLKNNYNTYIETFKKNYVMILNEITHIQHTNKKGETQQYSQNSKDFDAIIQKLKNQMTQRWTNMEKMPYLINELIWYGPNTKLSYGTWSFTCLNPETDAAITYVFEDGKVGRVAYLKGYGEKVTLAFADGRREIEKFLYLTVLSGSKFNETDLNKQISNLTYNTFIYSLKFITRFVIH
jgi:hypothetical protein